MKSLGAWQPFATAAKSDEAQAEIKQWYIYLNKIGNYSPEAFKGLGQKYVDDERFTKISISMVRGWHNSCVMPWLYLPIRINNIKKDVTPEALRRLIISTDPSIEIPAAM